MDLFRSIQSSILPLKAGPPYRHEANWLPPIAAVAGQQKKQDAEINARPRMRISTRFYQHKGWASIAALKILQESGSHIPELATGGTSDVLDLHHVLSRLQGDPKIQSNVNDSNSRGTRPDVPRTCLHRRIDHEHRIRDTQWSLQQAPNLYLRFTVCGVRRVSDDRSGLQWVHITRATISRYHWQLWMAARRYFAQKNRLELTCCLYFYT